MLEARETSSSNLFRSFSPLVHPTNALKLTAERGFQRSILVQVHLKSREKKADYDDGTHHQGASPSQAGTLPLGSQASLRPGGAAWSSTFGYHWLALSSFRLSFKMLLHFLTGSLVAPGLFVRRDDRAFF